LELSAQKTGELTKHQTTTINNLVMAADYLRLRSELIAALRPFPDAQRAVIAVFRGIEDGLPAQQPPKLLPPRTLPPDLVIDING
jgi:hypothetical protein